MLFPHCTWSDFPYKPIIEAIGRNRSVYMVTSDVGITGAPAEFRALAWSELTCIPWGSTMAVVTHPCWLFEVCSHAPAVLAVLLPAEFEHGDDAYSRCRDRLCAAATLVVTGSEPFYFEQSFRRGSVFIQDGLDTAADLIALAAVSDAASGLELSSLVSLQLQRRTVCRAQKLKLKPDEPVQLFFQSVYWYLLFDA